MAEAPLLYLLPEAQSPVASGGIPYAVPEIPHRQARLTRQERDRTTGQWADLGAARLASVMRMASQGDVSSWVDLCEYYLRDPVIGGLYATRLDRVAQAPMEWKPNEFGNPREAALAAEFVSEQMGRIQNWKTAKRQSLHAIAIGFQCHEYELDYDKVNGVNYIKRLHWVHSNRMRYDEQWQLRLYDHGAGNRRSKASPYGEILHPHKWLVHQYQAIPGYPGLGGLMASCIYQLVFMRWNEKWWVNDTERNGGAFTYASVPGGLPAEKRTQILEELRLMSAERVGVFELPSTLTIDAAASAAKTWESYVNYKKEHAADLAQLWLGASDIASPGEHGSQSAVTARGAMTTDPRMVTDAELFGQSLESLAADLIFYNGHKFGVPVSQVPVPCAVLKTADDQVKSDPTGIAQENAPGQPGSSLTPEVGKGMDKPAPGQPAGASAQPQDAMVLEIMKAFAAGNMTDGGARVMLRRQGMSEDEIAASLERPDPKAQAPARPGHTSSKTTTRATSGRSRSPLATALRSASAGSASSSSKPLPLQLKL